MDTNMGGTFCPQCGVAIPADAYFCPNCGKKLAEPPVSTSVLMQVGLYTFAIFLPPLGLWPGIKYVRRGNAANDLNARRVGWITIALTIISTIVTTWLTIAFLNSYIDMLNRSLGGF